MTERGPLLLEARDLRVDIDGAVALERTTFEAHGTRIVVAGDGYALLAALAGAAPIRAGTLRILGHDVGKGEHLASVGFAPLDPPLMAPWTVSRLLTWSARLSGLGKGAATAAAARTLADLNLASLQRARLGALGVAQRRAVVLAQAVVSSPVVLLAGAPLAGLAPPWVAYVAEVLALAEKGRSSIVSLSTNLAWLSPRVPEHGLAAHADELLVFAAGRLVRQGKPSALASATTSFLMTVRAPPAELIAAISALGARCVGGPSRFWVDLPAAMSAADVLAEAHRAGVPIVELSPQLPPSP